MQLSMKAARVNAGLTQTEMANIVGVSNTSISLWEKGIAVPNAINFIRYCKACDVDPRYIFLPDDTRKARADE